MREASMKALHGFEMTGSLGGAVLGDHQSSKLQNLCGL